MIKKLSAASFILSIAVFFQTSSLSAGNGTIGASFLADNPSARQVAMGGVHTVNADAADGIHSNPAGLGLAQRSEVTLSYNTQQDNGNYGFTGFLQPVIRRENFSLGAGIGLIYYSAGNIDIHFSNGSPSRSLKSETAYAGILAVGARFGRWISVGLAPKYLNSTLVEQYSSKATALDGGVIIHPFPDLLKERLSFGGTFQNYGSKLNYKTAEQSLPETTAFGAGLKLLNHREYGAFSVSAQAENTLGENTKYRLGSEYALGARETSWEVFLRGGYRFRVETEDYSLGLGVRETNIEVNYAFVNVSGLDRTHRLTLSFRFGRFREPKLNESLGTLDKETDATLKGAKPKLLDAETEGKKEEPTRLIDAEKKRKSSKPLIKDETKDEEYKLYKESDNSTDYKLIEKEERGE